MSVRSGQSVTVLFSTRVFATGVGTNADSTPTGTLYLNGTADGATVTVTNITTGLYKAAVTLPTLAVGDVVVIRIAATVSGVTDSAPIWTDSKDFFAGSIPDVIAGGAGGLFIAGSNAATTIASLTVTTTTTLTGNVSMAAGLNITQSSANTSALVITGNGTGDGILATSGSGATGNGIKAISAATNGNGIHIEGTGSESALNIRAAGSGPGLEIVSVSGLGVRVFAVATGISITGNYVLTGNWSAIGALTAGSNAIPWNAAWDAEVQSECEDALAAYDGPTNTEMVARTLVAADYATAANQTTINNSVVAIPAAITSDHGAGSYQTATGFAEPGDVMQQDMTQAVPTTNTAQTLGDALNAARAQGFGKWALVGTTLTLYAADGTTVVRTFTLDSATAPTSRT